MVRTGFRNRSSEVSAGEGCILQHICAVLCREHRGHDAKAGRLSKDERGSDEGVSRPGCSCSEQLTDAGLESVGPGDELQRPE